LSDTADGKELWKFATRAKVDSSPVVVDKRVFVGSNDGRLYALDHATGKKVWEYEAGGHFVASPAVADGRLVIGNTDGTLYCFGEKK
jgi:outer membrane protein assembly factor BamB